MGVRGSNSLYFSSELNTDGLRSGASEASGIVQNLATTIGRISPFGILAVGASTAFSAIAQSSYNMMKEFEHNMKEVETISKATQENFKGISSEVFALSKISPDAPAALAKAYYQIVSAGYDGAAGLELLETAAKAATAGVTDTQTAADGITTVLNAFKMEASEAENVADTLFQTVKLGKTNFEELSRNLAVVAPLAASTGFSFEEVAAAVATLTKQGTPTNVAMTQIRSAIEKVGEVMGDGVSKTMTLQNAFQAMYNQSGGSQKNLTKLVGSIEAVQAVLGVSGRNAIGAAEDLKSYADAAGAADEANKRMLSSNTNEWKILGNRISATTEDIGNALVEMSSGLAGFLNGAVDDSNNLTAAFDKQKIELYRLTDALKATEEGSDEWKKIRDEILQNYPEFIGQIDAETVSTQNLLGVLEDVNRAYVERYKVNKRNQELENARQKQAQLELNIEDTRDQFEGFVNELRAEASREGIELKVDMTDSTDDIIRSIEEQLKKVDPASLKGGYFSQGYAADNLLNMEALNNIISAQTNSLKDQKQAVDELSQSNRRKAQADLKTAEGLKLAVEEIGKAMSASDLTDYVGSGIEEVEWAIEKRTKVLDQLEQIKQADSIDSLKPFLEAQSAEVKKYAEKRKRMLTTDFAILPQGDDKEFSDLLKKKEQEYKEYSATVKQLGQETADAQFQALLQEGNDYGQYLNNLLDKTRNFAKQRAIALAAEGSGIQLNRENVSTVNELTPQGVQDFTVDTTSINAFQRKITELQTQIDAEQDESRRRELQAERDKWEEKLSIARNGSEEEKSIYETIPAELDDLNNKALINYRVYWKNKLKEAKAGQDKIAAEEAELKVGAASKIIGDRTADTIRNVSGSLGEASDMFRKFGDDDLADMLDKLSAVGNNVATIAAGVASGDWLSVAGGVMGTLSALFSGGNDSPKKTAYERSIERLEGSIGRLGNEIERAFGTELIEKSKDQLEQYEAQVGKLKDEYEEMKRLRDAGGHLGVMFEGLGGEDRLEELNNKISDLENEFEGAAERLKEILTGTTGQTIADSIIQGFRDGKRGIEDFADTFEDLMKDAILNTFKQQYLMEALMGEDGKGGFYGAFAEAGKDGLTEQEIKELQGLWGGIITGAEESLEGMDKIFGDMGWDPFGASGTQQQGMSGAIKGITENTAGTIEGYMNAMRLDLRGIVEHNVLMMSIQTQSLDHLSEIASNTRYNRHLATMDLNIIKLNNTMISVDNRMSTVEGAIQSGRAQG